MEREMRRKKQLLSPAEAEEILERGTHGVLALIDGEGEPYALPMSYVYSNGRLFFHCAKAGHKLEAVRSHGRASFCVVAKDEVWPEELTTRYRSAIAFGSIREMADGAEKLAAIRALTGKYCPNISPAELDAAIERELPALNMLELTIDRLSGKRSRLE